ncbi:MAG TPA: DUF4249 domain-containing protein [Mucilaginibacter sp.]
MTNWQKLLLIAVLFSACKKPFVPPNTLNDTNKYLVIDGVINAGSDSTFIKLSRTKKFENGITIDHETGAQLNVEGDDNSSYQLVETVPGTYASAGLNLNASHKYRLRIKTTNGKEYLSDFVVVKNSPLIDSVGFTAKPTALTIYANSHDATNNTKYYRWEYTEAWEFHSTYESFWDGTAPRAKDDYVYYCFAKDTSSYITLATTTKLSNDVVYQAPITTIDPSSEKIEIRYSIEVKQFALTSDAYNFWDNLHKNNETNGTIFDIQPSDNQTNYHCLTDPGELVVGYLSVGSVATKRIFIDRGQLLSSYNPQYAYANGCQVDTAYYAKNQYGIFVPPTTYTAIEGFYYTPPAPFGAPTQITYSTRDCADCTTRGVTQPPSFWR